MTKTLRVAGAQLDLVVGDIAGNTEAIVDAMEWASAAGADVLLLPELAITGYPPEDLVLRGGFIDANLEALAAIAAASDDLVTVVGFVDRLEVERMDDDSVPRRVTNAAAVVSGGRVVSVYHKTLLPNYGVFDEARYFAEGRSESELHSIAGVVCGISICEDIWDAQGRPTAQALGGAQVLLNINGSPFHVGKSEERLTLLRNRAMTSGAHVVYVNCVGGQDELVFDGGSMVIAPDGALIHRSPLFEVDTFVVDIDVPIPARPIALPIVPVSEPVSDRGPSTQGTVTPMLSHEAEIYRALTCALAGYVTKNGFKDVVIGLSGGIDSALTASIAVDALGPDSVLGITMPARYSSDGSVSDSLDLAERLGFRADVIPIDDVFSGFLSALEPQFAGTVENVAEENLQARIRGTILMAISNKFGSMVVATGNKSEMAVGYATLYGDMAGGYAILKDVYKTTVYDLARWRNRHHEVIPMAIIDKPPSAELRPDQFDADSLPPYPVLDAILWEYIESDRTAGEIISQGHDPVLVKQIAGMVDRNEYKRRQAAPGVKITKKAFGRDRRLPITNRFRP